MMAPLSLGKGLQNDRVMLVYTIFVAATFNLMVIVRVAVRFTEETWVIIRKHFENKPILETMMELLIMEGSTSSQSPARGMAKDRARAFRREEGTCERRESKVD